MSGQLELIVATGSPHTAFSCQRSTEAHAAIERIAMRSLRVEDLITVEAGRVPEDRCMVLGGDLSDATKGAGLLAANPESKPHQIACPRPERGGLVPWQERKIRAYVEEQLERCLLVGDLANVLSLSVSYFSRCFKKSFGDAPHTYIVKRRIARAQVLMRTTGESLSQIALACGLWDQAHLCRCFRQVTGTTPGAWRRRHAIGLIGRGALGDQGQGKAWQRSFSSGRRESSI